MLIHLYVWEGAEENTVYTSPSRLIEYDTQISLLSENMKVEL